MNTQHNKRRHENKHTAMAKTKNINQKKAREAAIRQLQECQNNRDIEQAHYDADDILCDLLTSLGFADVVAEYEKVDKWFA